MKDTCHPVSVEDSVNVEREDTYVSSSVCGRQHECREGKTRVIQCLWKLAGLQRGKNTHLSSNVCRRQHECREGKHVRVIQQCLWKTAGVQRGSDTCHPMPVENSVSTETERQFKQFQCLNC